MFTAQISGKAEAQVGRVPLSSYKGKSTHAQDLISFVKLTAAQRSKDLCPDLLLRLVIGYPTVSIIGVEKVLFTVIGVN